MYTVHVRCDLNDYYALDVFLLCQPVGHYNIMPCDVHVGSEYSTAPVIKEWPHCYSGASIGDRS